MNKKTIFSLMMVAMLLLLAACGGGNTVSEDSAENNTGSESNGDEKENVEPIVLTMAFMNSTEHIQHDIMVEFAQEVEEKTDGRVKIEIYPGGALAAPPAAYDAAVSGIADFSWGLQGYTAGRFPLTSIINIPLPKIGTPTEMSKIFWELYQEFPEVQEEYKDTKPIYLNAGDEYHIVTAGKQVKTLEDLKGLKLRSTSQESKNMIEAWGATPVSMPMPDVYDAMEKGVIDGGVLNLSSIEDFNLYDVVDYVTMGSFHSVAFFNVMNKDSWNKLTAEDQEIIEGLIGEKLVLKAAKGFETTRQVALDKFDDAGIEVYEMPNDELARLKAVFPELKDEWIADKESKGLPGEEVYQFVIDKLNEL